MVDRPLLELEDVIMQGENDLSVGPISLKLFPRGRVWLEGFEADQVAAIESLLAGQKKHIAGRLLEAKPVQFLSDQIIRQRYDFHQSISDFLESHAAPSQVWLEGRKRSVRVLVDRLGLTPKDMRSPVHLSSGPVQDKFIALRLLLSRADILLISSFLHKLDTSVKTMLASHWGDFPGVIIAACDDTDLPGVPDMHRVYENGQITIGSGNQQ